MTDLENKVNELEIKLKEAEGKVTTTHAQIESLIDAVDLRMEGVTKEISNLKELFSSKLDSILIQTTKTNGRVTVAETKIEQLTQKHFECPIREVQSDIKIIRKDVDRIDTDTEQAQFKQKYPKLANYMIIGMVVVFIGASIGIATSYFKLQSEFKTIIEKVEKVK